MKTLDQFSEYLRKELIKKLPAHELSDVIIYSALPAGKMIRARIILSLAEDLKLAKESAFKLAAFLELHHTYTLIHDDLPAMDNDDMRRGRPSSHKKFNEWKAILGGDSLMNISYQFLAELGQAELFKLALWSTGPKGLIGGQYLDLNSKPKNFSELLRLHELKTSRLFVLACLGPALLARDQRAKDFFRLGNEWGLYFQLSDDMDDKDHPQFQKQTEEKMQQLKKSVISRMEKLNLKTTRELFKN